MTKNEIIKKYESLNQVHYHNKNDRDLVEQMMQEYADQQLILSGVSQRSELFLVFAEFKDQWEHDNNNMDSNEVIVNKFLKTNNCG